MRLLFSLTYYSPYVSGLTLYVKRLAEALVKKGYQVSVISFQYQKDLSVEENIEKVKVIRAKPLLKVSKGFISVDWLVKCWQEIRRNDVIIVNLPQFEGVVPALLGRLLGKKVISIYHCEVVLPEGLLNRFIECILNLSNRLTLLLSQHIITYTEDFAKHAKILPRFSYKIKYIYPPIIKPKVNKRVQKILLNKIGLKPTFIIGVAARLAAEKGIEYLLESIPAIISKIKDQRSKLQLKTQSYKNSLALKHLGGDRMGSPEVKELGRTFKIVIAGSMESVGEKKYKEKILKLVEKYREYIVFLGELKEEEMGSFYSLLDVLVLPSINSTEAFGMVQVEAMMMGVPVVSSDLPGVRVPIQKTGMGLLVPVKNSQKLAEAIVEVMLSKKKYIKDRENIEKEFSIEKTIAFYQKLLCRKIY